MAGAVTKLAEKSFDRPVVCATGFWFCSGQKFNLALPFASFQIGFNIDTEAFRKKRALSKSLWTRFIAFVLVLRCKELVRNFCSDWFPLLFSCTRSQSWPFPVSQCFLNIKHLHRRPKNWDLFSGTPHPESCASSDAVLAFWDGRSSWEWNRSC